MRRALAISLLVHALGCNGSNAGLVDASGSDDGDDAGGGGGGRTVKLTLTDRPTNAAMFSFLVAYQDGSAPWTLAPPPTGDTYAFSINAPSYGVAYTCVANLPGTTATQIRSVNTAHFAVGERTELTLDVPTACSDRAPMTVTVAGTVINRPLKGVLVVEIGDQAAFVSPASGGFALQAPPGTHDLVVAHAIPEGNGDYYVEDVLVMRHVALTGSASRTIDFADATPTRSWQVGVEAHDGAIVASTKLYTPNGTEVGLVHESINWQTVGLAEPQTVAGDVYEQTIAVTTAGQGATITNVTSTPGPQRYVAPTPLGAVTTTLPSKLPYASIDTAWQAYPDTVGYTWTATQVLTGPQCRGNLGCTVSWTAMLSPGVTGDQPGYRMPDLAGLAGWTQALELVAGTPVLGNVTATTSSAGANDFPTGIPGNGTTRTSARRDWTITP